MAVHYDIQEKPSYSLGLVLEGGGAKGAYAFGALRAFAEKGVKFSAVAGTSVGALNAAIWASGKLSQGKEIWEHLTVERVFPYRRPKWFFKAILLVLVPVRLCLGYFSYALPSDLEAKISTIMRAIHAFLFVITVVIAVHEIPLGRTPTLLWVWLISWLGGLYLTKRFHRRLEVAHLVNLLVFAVAGVLGTWVAVHLARTLVMPQWLTGFIEPTLMCLVIAVVITCWFFFPDWLETLSSRRNAPLREAITGIVAAGRLMIPTYATMAVKRYIFDPDDYYSLQGKAQRYILYKRSFIPEYTRLNELDIEGQVNRLLASAALPFGIAPSVKVGKTRFVDGGVVDNCPIYPLAKFLSCSKLVVIRLSSTPRSWTQMEWKRSGQIARILKIAESGVRPEGLSAREPGERYNNPPTIIPLKPLPNFPRIRVLSPNDDLGGFRKGTLNFTAAYTKKQIERGYAEALQFILANAGFLEIEREKANSNRMGSRNGDK